MTNTPRLQSSILNSARISHGFFTRDGGVSSGLYTSLNCGPGSADDPKAVQENRRRVAQTLSGDAATALCSVYQVHGRDTVTVTAPWPDHDRPKADAMATAQPGLILGILTADCTPVLLCDPDARVIGAAHAGWKGAFTGVIGSVIAAMENLGATRHTIQAAIGPTIGQASYEVSADFMANFINHNAEYDRYFAAGQDADHAQFNLPAFVYDRLDAENIGAIDTLGIDTYPDNSAGFARFFSYRRTTHRGESDYGRQISAIMIKP